MGYRYTRRSSTRGSVTYLEMLSRRRPSIRTIALAKNLSSQKTMEAFTSERALDEAVNEGSYQHMKKLPKTSLPQRKKRHIFDGLDTSFIARDILKIPGSSRPSKMSVYQEDIHKPTSSRKVAHTSEKPRKQQYKPLNPTQEYKSFIRDRAIVETDTFRSLPVLSHRSADIPVSYNNFYSNFIENGRIKRDEETCQSRESLKKKTAPEKVMKCGIRNVYPESIPMDYVPLDKLMLHIDDIKRLMGRQKTAVPSQRSEPKSFYRLPSKHSTNSCSGSELLKFSRHGTRKSGSTIPTRATTCTSKSSTGRGFQRSIISHVQKLPNFDINKNKLVPDITVLSPREKYSISHLEQLND